MNFYEGLVTGFEVRGVVVHIETDAAFWIKLSKRLEGAGGLDTLLDAIISIERSGVAVGLSGLSESEQKGVVERLVWFMRGGKDESPQQAKKPHKERVLDYIADFDAIYAAFMQVYQIDLYSLDGTDKPYLTRMHWWQFKALLDNLPSGNLLVDYYMHYRGMDLSTLPRKTASDNKYYARMADIKQSVKLNKPKAEPEPFFVELARKRREGNNG